MLKIHRKTDRTQATEAPERLKIHRNKAQKNGRKGQAPPKKSLNAIFDLPPVRVDIPLHFAASKIPDKLLKKPFPRQNLH